MRSTWICCTKRCQWTFQDIRNYNKYVRNFAYFTLILFPWIDLLWFVKSFDFSNFHDQWPNMILAIPQQFLWHFVIIAVQTFCSSLILLKFLWSFWSINTSEYRKVDEESIPTWCFCPWVQFFKSWWAFRSEDRNRKWIQLRL